MTGELAGILERVLTRRYGAPIVRASTGHEDAVWNAEEKDRECVLYKPLVWTTSLRNTFGSLEAAYGNARGGHLLGDSLRMALLSGPESYSLYSIVELNSQEEVQRANQLRPRACFFMDAANVWYYGIEKNDLVVYDTETDEVDSLGPVESALNQLLDEWEAAK